MTETVEQNGNLGTGRVRGKVVLVTGGAKGIGGATAVLLARHGAKVVVGDLAENEGAEVVDAIQSAGGDALFTRLDVASEDSVQRVVAEIVKQWGRLDVLVNNAGLAGIQKPIHEVTTAEYDRVMDVNVRGVFHCTKHAIPVMQAGASIINLSSIYGLVGGASADSPYSVYQASKGAVIMMTKSDAMMYAHRKIRVNAICPGFVSTPMVAGFFERTGDAEAARAGAARLHPLGCLGEPEDIAYGILYLASDEARFVTGAVIPIDGGFTAQ
ncbi:SDR family oxidoreductase [Burkholderia cenocepacia]|uniref:SDR family NAD(P)-dependent oxidoreductase n=1 Tax=Burkholderia cenocepacia TaxID=95486 RepID=UPI001205D871|nr:SDR family oxidoreductase [Burkholderia cenocepacia]MBR8393959.1 SDR family oxidoreductase [Burkholderia cenocepacia]TAM55474.1 MAG: SDR family oxidoreductase [Paraburkholderia sp.]